MLRKLNRVLSKLVKVATSLKKQSNLQVADDVATEQMCISLQANCLWAFLFGKEKENVSIKRRSNADY